VKPGIYENLDFDKYLAEPGLSKSAVTKLIISQAHYDAYISGEIEVTDEMKFGSAIDRCIFDGDKTPAEKLYPKDTKKDKSYRDAMVGMLASLKRCNTAQQLLSNGSPQVSIFWESEVGVMMKSRPDYIKKDWLIAADFKTAANASWWKWRWSARDTGADTQAAIAVDGLFELTGDVYDFVFIVQEKKPPYAVAVYAAPPAMLESGRAKYRMAIPLYKEYWEDGICRGYPDEVIENLDW